jgi:hypothetical protein
MYGAGLVVGKRRGHIARFVGATREWKRDWSRNRDGQSITWVLKRVSTRRQLRRVLTFVTAQGMARSLAF